MKLEFKLTSAVAALVALRIRAVEATAMGSADTKWRLAFDELQSALYTAIAEEADAGAVPPESRIPQAQQPERKMS